MTDTTRWLSAKEMADRLGVTRWEVTKLARAGVLHGILLPGRAGWRFPPSELDRLLEEQLRERRPKADEAADDDEEPALARGWVLYA